MRLLISTGEVSGDLQGSLLIKALKDNAAAMRYTESRMTRLSSEILKDLEKETVNWELNFDETLKEKR